MRQRRLIARALAAVVVASTLLVACGDPSRPLGAGPDVDVCDGIRVFDELPEPSPEDARAVDRWIAAALRVLDRVDPKERVTDVNDKERVPPDDIIEAYTAIEASVRSLRARVDAASAKGAKAVRSAADSLAGDDQFNAAYTKVRSFHDEVCE